MISPNDAALMDFLMRRPPRLKRAHVKRVDLGARRGRDAVTTRAVVDLDASALFVQGPPGTGQTYTIGAVIVELLKSLKEVENCHIFRFRQDLGGGGFLA
jgi:hypothetical protein